MSNILLVLSSPRLGESVSSKLATELANKLAAKHGGKLTVRDVATKPLPHIDHEYITATRSGATSFSPAGRAALDRTQPLLDELFAADTIVIGAGLFNFGAPSTLKAWIDHIAVPQKTFRYGASGPEGLVRNKKVYVVTASAGAYGDGPGDYLKPWLAFALGFMGMTDVEFIRVDSLAYGPEAVEKAMNEANAKIKAIAG